MIGFKKYVLINRRQNYYCNNILDAKHTLRQLIVIEWKTKSCLCRQL